MNKTNLKERGLDLSTLAKDGEQLKAEGGTMSTTASRSAPVFTVEVCDWPDFCVSRKCGKSEQRMVFMPSSQNYYVKNMNTGGIKPLDKAAYSIFTRDMPNLVLQELWLPRLNKGAEFYEIMLQPVLKHPYVAEMLKKRILADASIWSGPRWSLELHLIEVREIYQKYAGLYECAAKAGVKLKEETLELYKIIGTISDTYSFDRGIDFTRHASECLVRFSRGNTDAVDSLNELLELCSFEYESLRNYLLYASVQQGYAFNFSGWIRTWRDTVRMQVGLFGKVKEKYPKSLVLLHDQLAYKYLLKREEIDEAQFQKQAELAAGLERSLGDYVIIAPTCREDFYEEATQQANCLASYVGSFTEGRCVIMFMRRKDEPETALVTLELRRNHGRWAVVQAKRAHNRKPKQEETEILRRYEAEINHDPAQNAG